MKVLSAVAWPYANGPRHLGHVAGFGVPSDVFSRYMRMAGHDVLMVSGSDEHGTPDPRARRPGQGVTPRELVDTNHAVIASELTDLGCSYDLYTRTTTANHYAVAQELFTQVWRNGYMVEQTTQGAISPSTGRTLPDRYIEGTCPICGYGEARGDQCDNCGNQLDPTDLIDPRSRINGETPRVRRDPALPPRPARARRRPARAWLEEREASGTWRPNVIKFSLNILDDIRPRAMTRDIDWGIPVPLDGWRDNPTKRLYVWFDAVVGYLSASVEWARRTGDPERWREWWNDPEALSYYFMGKDNITFHSQIWPAELLGVRRARAAAGGEPGVYGELNLPTEVVSSEYLTMEGKQFSTSRGYTILVRDVLERYGPDGIRYFICAAGPENQDTNFTWREFVQRNNSELVAGWGNLVSRTARDGRQELRRDPAAGRARAGRRGGARHGARRLRHRRRPPRAAPPEGRHRRGDARRRRGQRLRLAHRAVQAQGRRPARAARHGAAHPRAVRVRPQHDPRAVPPARGQPGATRCSAATATFVPMPRLETVTGLDDGDEGRTYPVITGDYSATPRWESRPVVVGTPISKPAPVLHQARRVGRRRGARAAPGALTRDVAAEPARCPEPPDPLPIAVVDNHTHLDISRDGEDVSGRRTSGRCSRRPRRSASTGSCRSAATSRVRRFAVEAADRYPGVLAGVALHPNEVPGLAASGGLDAAYAEIERLAAPPAGAGRGGDRPRLLPHRPRGRSGAAGLVPLAHRPGQAPRQGTCRSTTATATTTCCACSPRRARRSARCCTASRAGLQMARECVDRGYYLSFSGTVTFKSATALRDALSVTPLELLLVETDAPYLTPHPWRGATNAPGPRARSRCGRWRRCSGSRCRRCARRCSENAERALRPLVTWRGRIVDGVTQLSYTGGAGVTNASSGTRNLRLSVTEI